MSKGISYQALAHDLGRTGMWKSVTGFQRVDFNRRFTLVIEDSRFREILVERGLDLSGVHLNFGFHKRRDTVIKVYLSQLPIGVTSNEIQDVLSYLDDIIEVNPVTKVLYNRKIDTGYRIVIFKRIARHILSHVLIRGWRAFVKHAGQPLTCQVCGLTGHFAKDCPATKSSKNKLEDVPGDTMSEDKAETGTEPMDSESNGAKVRLILRLRLRRLSICQESLLKNQLAVHLFLSLTPRIVMNTFPSLTQIQKKLLVPRPYRTLFNPSLDLITLL